MQHTHDLSLGLAAQAKPQDRAAVRAGSRLAYVDTVRTILIILVIMVHAATTYHAIGGWTYTDPAEDEFAAILLSFFVIICQSFFMGLYFFFAGYFTPGSYERKGPAQFLKDRLLRLGIPLAAYTLLLSKIPNYLNALSNEGWKGSFWQYVGENFWSEADAGPTWFIFILLIFSAAYALWRISSHGSSIRLNRLPVPSILVLLIVGVVMGALTFSVSQLLPLGKGYELFESITLMLQFFPTYIVLFAAGVLAYRGDWLPQLPGKALRFWAWFSAALLVALPAIFFLGGVTEGYEEAFFSGLNPRCALFTLWLGLACVSFSITLTLWVRDRVKINRRLAAFAGANTFAVYIIHPLVLVPITYALSFLAIPALAKFGLASVFAVGLCFPIAGFLRRISGLKEIL